MLEKELEKKFAEAVKKCGGIAFKFVSPGNAGVPDRLVVLPGGHIGFVELKQEGKRPTPLQRRQQNRLRELGCFVTILDHTRDILRVIEQIGLEAGNEK